MSMSYRVVYAGRVKPGVDGEKAARDFAEIFKVPHEKAWKLVLGGDERVLKSEVDAVNAERYRALLDEIGLDVRVEGREADESLASPEPASDSGLRPVQAGATSPAATARVNPVESPASRSRDAGGRSGDFASASNAGVSDVDPYAPPAPDRTAPGGRSPGDRMMTGPHALAIGHGWQWIARGFELFRRSPLIWIGAVALLMLINIVISLVPGIGGLISSLIGPVFLGGLMLGAQAQASGGRLQIGYLFAGFSAHSGRLLALGGLYLLAVFAIVVFAGILLSVLAVGVGGVDPAVFEQQDPTLALATLGPMVMLAVLFLLMLLIPVVMAYWFAPALIVLEDLLPVEAAKLSFFACWRNLLPFLVYGLAALALVFIGLIPFGLGLLIVSPILIASIYAAYRDIFYGY